MHPTFDTPKGPCPSIGGLLWIAEGNTALFNDEDRADQRHIEGCTACQQRLREAQADERMVLELYRAAERYSWLALAHRDRPH